MYVYIGKGESMWDQMLHEHPEGVVDGTNGDVAADSYHRYREDVKMLKNIGVSDYKTTNLSIKLAMANYFRLLYALP